MKEIWKEISGYEGLYEVSNKGNVRGVDRYISRIRKGKETKPIYIKGKQLKQSNSNGYQVISLNNSKKRRYYVHRLVAIEFLKNSLSLPCVNHIDGKKENNTVDNLEWCTHLENTRHAKRNGLSRIVSGDEHVNSKLKSTDIPIIFKMSKSLSAAKIAIVFGVSTGAISCVLSRKSWAHINLSD
jgi:hypothetical protein